jgi:hypothetical protein
MLRVFQLWRDEDVSRVSGVGRVAVGVVFLSGKVVLEWPPPLGSTTSWITLNGFTATAVRAHRFCGKFTARVRRRR